MQISYSQIEDQCNELHATANSMKETIDFFNSKLKLIDSSEIWTGEAAEFYKEKLRKLLENYNEIFVELENSVLFLASCAEGYKAIDETVVKEICNNLNITSPNLSTTSIFDRSKYGI